MPMSFLVRLSATYVLRVVIGVFFVAFAASTLVLGLYFGQFHGALQRLPLLGESSVTLSVEH